MSTNTTPLMSLSRWLLSATMLVHGVPAQSNNVDTECCPIPVYILNTLAYDIRGQCKFETCPVSPLQLAQSISADDAAYIVWSATGWEVVGVRRRGRYYEVTVRSPDGREQYTYRVDRRTGHID